MYVCNCIFLGALGNDGWVTFSNLRRILDNLCELVKSQPTEEFTDVLVQALSGLTLMILRSSTTKSSEDSEKFTKTILKKTRGFFSYEKVKTRRINIVFKHISSMFPWSTFVRSPVRPFASTKNLNKKASIVL